MNEDTKQPLLDGSAHYSNYSGEQATQESPDHEITTEDVVEAARRVVNAIHADGSGDLHKYSPLYFKVSILHYIRSFSMVGLLLLTFFERPWWCHQTPGNCENTEVFLFSDIPLLNAYATDLTAIVFLGLLLFALELRQLIMGRRDLLELAQSVIIIISLLDTIVAMLWEGYREFIFISPFLRPILYVLTFKKIREEFVQVISIIKPIFELLVLLVILMISFAWFGLILFYDEEEMEKKYFASYGEAMYNMFIFLTTANSPDVRMPMYWLYRPTVFYFIIFECIGLYFILPFIFASVYNNYKDMVTARTQAVEQAQVDGVLSAFDLLDRGNKGYIDTSLCKDALGEVVRIMTPVKESGQDTALEDLVEELWIEEDLDNKKVIDADTFVELCFDIHDLKQLHDQPKEIIQDMSSLPFHSELSLVIFNPNFEIIINTLLVINGVLFGMQTYYFIHDIDGYYRHRAWWTVAEYLFSVIWCLEMASKIYVMGPRGYFGKVANIFDSTIILLGVVTTLMSHLTIVDTRVVRIVLLIRTFRLLRLFSQIPKFRMIFATFLILLRKFSYILGVLVFQYYLFGLIAIRAFGGLLYIGNPLLRGTAYEAAMYFPNNFNDFASTVVVLFDLMVINNWFIYMDAVALVTQSEASKLFFFLFYFFTNILTLNLLVANILDAVSSQLESLKQQEDKEKEDILRSSHVG